MKKYGLTMLVAAGLAVTATPARADWSWSWVNACGGDNFVTCMSGDISYSGGVITVHVTNLPTEIDVFTAVGLFNLPSIGGSYVQPTAYTDGGLGWSPNNGINGAGLTGTNDARYAIGSSGIGGGFTEGDGQQTFTFTFSQNLDAYADQIGVGIHAQGGPGGCSTKMGVTSGGEVDNSSNLNPDCASTTVPEPASMVLLATGLLGLGVVGYRRRNGQIETE